MNQIAAGAVDVALPDCGRGRLVEGDFFGEMALLSREPRSATGTATVTTDLLIIDAVEFLRLCERVPDMREKVEAVA